MMAYATASMDPDSVFYGLRRDAENGSLESAGGGRVGDLCWPFRGGVRVVCVCPVGGMPGGRVDGVRWRRAVIAYASCLDVVREGLAWTW